MRVWVVGRSEIDHWFSEKCARAEFDRFQEMAARRLSDWSVQEAARRSRQQRFDAIAELQEPSEEELLAIEERRDQGCEGLPPSDEF